MQFSDPVCAVLFSLYLEFKKKARPHKAEVYSTKTTAIIELIIYDEMETITAQSRNIPGMTGKLC